MATCGRHSLSSRQESPIAIPAGVRTHLVGITPDYHDTPVQLAEDPYAVRSECETGSYVRLGGTRYELEQFHFHSPGEHTLSGIAFGMELHLVHSGSGDRWAIISVMIREGRSNPAVDAVTAALHGDPSATCDPGDLLPDTLRHVAYTGSLTQPPYSTGVAWRVCLEPLEVSAAQLSAVGRIHPGNNRPLQPLQGRIFE